MKKLFMNWRWNDQWLYTTVLLLGKKKNICYFVQFDLICDSCFERLYLFSTLCESIFFWVAVWNVLRNWNCFFLFGLWLFWHDFFFKNFVFWRAVWKVNEELNVTLYFLQEFLVFPLLSPFLHFTLVTLQLFIFLFLFRSFQRSLSFSRKLVALSSIKWLNVSS
jgi:hypothetical protein